MIGLDTNVLVRHFAQDDPKQSPIASAFIETLTVDNLGLISLVVLVEFVWVMQARFEATREELIDVLQVILTDEHLQVQQASAAWLAFDHFDLTPNIDFPDALIAALGVELGATHTVTFDKKAARLEGMRLL